MIRTGSSKWTRLGAKTCLLSTSQSSLLTAHSSACALGHGAVTDSRAWHEVPPCAVALGAEQNMSDEPISAASGLATRPTSQPSCRPREGADDATLVGSLPHDVTLTHEWIEPRLPADDWTAPWRPGWEQPVAGDRSRSSGV